MTSTEKKEEVMNNNTSVSPPIPMICTSTIESVSDISSGNSLFSSPESKNFSHGAAGSVICSIISHDQLMLARERIRQEQDIGKGYNERIRESKVLTGGVISNNGCNRLGSSALELVIERTIKRNLENEEKEVRRYDVFMAKKYKAEQILSSKQGGYSFTELKTLVAYKKIKGESYSKQKKELEKFWETIKNRQDPCMELGRKLKESRLQSDSILLITK